MDYKTFKEKSGKARNEYGESIQKAIEEHGKLHTALCLKRDKAASDPDTEPKVVAQLGEHANEIYCKLKEQEQKYLEFQQMHKQFDAEANNVVAAHVAKREVFDGKLVCGSGSISIRPVIGELPKALKTFKEILEESKIRRSNRQSNANKDIVEAVLEKMKEIQNKK